MRAEAAKHGSNVGGWAGRRGGFNFAFLIEHCGVYSVIEHRQLPTQAVSNLSTLQCLQSSPCVIPPKDPSAWHRCIYSCFPCEESKLLQIHTQSHLPSLLFLENSCHMAFAPPVSSAYIATRLTPLCLKAFAQISSSW